MTGDVHTVYRVKSGECTWSAAEKLLRAKGFKNITTKMIVNEMNRLAQLNNETNVTNFNNKYFSKLPSSFYSDIKKQEKSVQKQSAQIIEQKEIASNHTNISQALNIEDGSYIAENNTIYVEPYPQKQNIKIRSQDEKEIDRINQIKDNKTKIIEFNKTNSSKNYLIVDKQNCTATIYTPDGERIKSVPVGLGKQKGDKMNRALKNNQWDAQGAYTTAGQFKLQDVPFTEHNIHGYKSEKTNKLNVYSLDGIQKDTEYNGNSSLAIHQVPKYRRNERNHLLQDDKTKNNIQNNRMSFGCINLLDSDFEEINKHVCAGSTLYILPEEKQNSMVLEKNPKGELAFRVEYGEPQDREIADRATLKYYNINEMQKLEMALNVIK